MADLFKDQKVSLTTPIESWAAITPHDSNQLSSVPRAIFCTVTGDAVLVGKDGTQVTFNLVAGNWYPFRPRLVKATGTTATVVALY